MRDLNIQCFHYDPIIDDTGGSKNKNERIIKSILYPALSSELEKEEPDIDRIKKMLIVCYEKYCAALYNTTLNLLVHSTAYAKVAPFKIEEEIAKLTDNVSLQSYQKVDAFSKKLVAFYNEVAQLDVLTYSEIARREKKIHKIN